MLQFIIAFAAVVADVYGLKGLWYENQALWDFQWKTNQWTYLEKATVEVGRTAIIGAVLIQKYAPPGPILDVGCGTGVLSDFLTPDQKQKYIGIDFSKEAVLMATNARNLTFIHTKAEDYIPPSNNFAVIAFNEVLYYVDFQTTLKKYTQYLAKDGIIIISKYHDYTRNGKMNQDPTLKYARSVYNLVEELQLSGNTPGNDNVTSRVQFRMEVFKIRD
mmetsp:Transcript_24942/g.25159  ORF Transcript_24942/g.25159 Transcript_24942/m.25159 type:complete len:218 (+) Transcript_24942:96-749(+)